MQNLNPPNSCLYLSPESIPISLEPLGYQVKVELYGSDAKIKQLSAYSFHPHQTTFWNYIKNWVIEFFYGKTVVLVKVEGQPSDLYIKVDELSRLLHQPVPAIQKKMVKQSATDFLISHQKKQTLKKILTLAQQEKFLYGPIESKGIKEVIHRIGYKNIFTVLDHPKFQTTRMVSTLLEMGRQLAQPSSKPIKFPNSYASEMTLPNIYISHIGKCKKTKINLKDLTLKVENLLKPLPLVSTQAPVSPSLFSSLTKKLQTSPKQPKEKQQIRILANKLGIKDEHLKHLHSLAARVNYANLITVLNGLEEEDQRIMINTFVVIGERLKTPVILDGIFAHFRLEYIGRKKIDGKQITYAFAINKNDILINQEEIDKGACKVVSEAIQLNHFDEFVRIKINKNKDKHEKTDSQYSDPALKILRDEAKFLETLYKNKDKEGGDCIVLPYLCEMNSNKKDKSPIFFQKKYSGDGKALKRVALHHQLYALRDVALGLNFLHELGFIHMDMKPANLLYEGDVQGSTPIKGKVSDFGLTVTKDSVMPGGTFWYLPPEALTSNDDVLHFNLFQVNEKVDSFCFGLTLLDIVDCFPIVHFGLLNQLQINQEIIKCKQRLQDSSPEKERAAKLAVLTIVHALIRVNPAERISCKEAANRLENMIQSLKIY